MANNRPFWICSSWRFPEHILTWNRTFSFIVMVLLSGTSCQISGIEKLIMANGWPLILCLLILVTCTVKCPAKNGWQVIQKYMCPWWWQSGPTNTRCPASVGSMLAHRLRRWPTTQFYIIIYTEVGLLLKAIQLSVDDLINLFTYYSDYVNYSINNIALNAIQTTCYLKTTRIIRPGRKPGAY